MTKRCKPLTGKLYRRACCLSIKTVWKGQVSSAADMGAQEASASKLAGSQAQEFRTVNPKYFIFQSLELSNSEFLRNFSGPRVYGLSFFF